MIQDENEHMAQALAHYDKANELADKQMYNEAIAEYTNAIGLADNFFEAIDNRAFSKMDLGLWQEAIEDFKLSLSVMPDSRLAEFSIGECYMRLGDNRKAKEQFKKALVIDPQHQPSKDFLAKVDALL